MSSRSKYFLKFVVPVRIYGQATISSEYITSQYSDTKEKKSNKKKAKRWDHLYLKHVSAAHNPDKLVCVPKEMPSLCMIAHNRLKIRGKDKYIDILVI